LLGFDALAYDDLRTGRLIMPFALTLPSGRCYAFICPKKRREAANVRAFRAWLREEVASLGRSARRAQPSFGPRRGRPRGVELLRMESGNGGAKDRHAHACGKGATNTSDFDSPPSIETQT
jgi:hypothetical protein